MSGKGSVSAAKLRPIDVSGIRMRERKSRVVTVAATQMAIGPDPDANTEKGERFVRDAAARGAQIILLQELFETPYFCKDQREELFALAIEADVDRSPFLARFAALAKELRVVLPISFFERSGKAFFNSLNGTSLGVYRKSHIPDGPGYQEKFYFSPGDTGFKVFRTKYADIGCAICWDQWQPECARIMALMGAEILFYPTAIGTEPQDPTLDSRHHWRRVMQGHAAANLCPVVASNRVGMEKGESCKLTFYGSSFITDHTGDIVASASDTDEVILTAKFDLEAQRLARASWGLFRDRRPELYGKISTLDGKHSELVARSRL